MNEVQRAIVAIRVRLILLLLPASLVLATTTASPAAPRSPAAYYVRTDGGSATQCTGLVDAPYPGNGTGQPCAWNHPFQALPPGGTPRIAGGDTLIIGVGSYMMGYGAPGAEACYPEGAFGCHMPAIPAGPDAAHRTRILGAGWDAGCADPPELWGAERPWFIVNLTDANNVEIGCLEITDHSSCVEFHTGGLACQRDSYPFGPWASYGLYAEDSADVYLHDLNIHGLAAGGVHAGRLTDWTVENVRIAGNGSVGWDGDLWDEFGDANSGTLTFRRWTVEWNGCAETWPDGQPAGCWAQTAGGYGDGVGTGETGGHWLIEDSAFLHNTSDGLDLLYARVPGSAIEIRRTRAEGNAGNQIKTTGPVTIENSVIVGNCGFFDGQSFTYNVDNCRAYGSAIDLTLRPGDQVTLTNNTLTSEGDCLVGAGCDPLPTLPLPGGGQGGDCDGSEIIRLRNNLFQGQTDFLQPDELTCLAYQETFPVDPFDFDYSVIANVKHDACPGPHATCGLPAGVVNPSIHDFDGRLLAGSPAINAGVPSAAPADDFTGRPRDPQPDIGAYEFAPTPCPDYDSDGQVTAADVQAVAARWRLTAADFDPDGDPATPNYAPAFDLDGDGAITVLDIQRAAAQLGGSCPCRPAVEFTHVPAYGSTEDLQGRVLCADPATHRIAVYIYVDGWYNKPYWDPRLTVIQPDGTWTCDVTTGGGDPWATQVAAFLGPADYNPPLMNGEGSLPTGLWSHAEAHRFAGRGTGPRQIQFGSYSWWVKAAATPVGPGPNYFSDRPEDVAVDAEGRLRLHIVQREGKWYSTEIVTDAPLGYGDYVFHIAPLARPLDQNAVVGLFTWDDSAPEYNYRELDVEFSRWGQPANQIAQYVVQPWDHTGNMYRFDFDLLADRSTHCFAWRSTSVAFQSLWGSVVCPGAGQGQIAAWTYTGADVPPAGAGNARINLWLYQGSAPSDGQAIEVVVDEG